MNKPKDNNVIDLDYYFYLLTLKKIFSIEFKNSELTNFKFDNSTNNLFNHYFVQNISIEFNSKYSEFIYIFLENNITNKDFNNNYDLNINIFSTQLINDLLEFDSKENEIYFIFSKLIKFIFYRDENNSVETNPKIDDLTYENLHQLSNIIIYFISKSLINPITGSILIAEIWPLVSYDQRLNQFIGREIEIFELQNQISNLKYIDDSTKIENIETKISNLKKKITIEADIFIRTIL